MSRNRLILVAYHFPPVQGSTGISRTLAFSRYLHGHGWDVCVLTIDPRAYEDTSTENDQLVADHVRVERAWGLDTRRSLSFRGKYPMLLAVPDRWQSWIWGAYRRGIAIAREWRPDAIMSTYPIASAHVIGRLLSRRTGLPWLAEFRDPMLQPNYPNDAMERWAYNKIEQSTFRHAQRVVVTTDGCRELYRQRFPDYPAEHLLTVSNGYDASLFERAGRSPGLASDNDSNRVVLLHSGLLYPRERNPDAFFAAVRNLADRRLLDGVEFRFRASGNEEDYAARIAGHGIGDYVKLEPRIPYVEAVAEMDAADGLMLFQAASCNQQIPAKAYEYLYCRKPILGLTDPAGDTGRLLQSTGVHSVAKLEDADQIEKVIAGFVEDIRNRRAYVVPMDIVSRYSRESLTGDLAAILNGLVGERQV